MNGYNFTERVRKVLAVAREDAASMGSDCVDTEHILSGVIRVGGGTGCAILERLAGGVHQVQENLQARSSKRGRIPGSTPDLPYTSAAKRVLEFAMDEARIHDHSYVGTEHLVLALIRHEKGVAARVLRESGVELAPARQEMVRLLGEPTPETGRTAPDAGGGDDPAPGASICPDCDVAMEPGYLLDKAGPRNVATKWVAGAPSDKPVVRDLDVIAYRCPDCGLLRLYT